MERLRVGHSPDADDAFMFYAFAKGIVTIGDYKIEQVLEDIESLNQRALIGDLEVTAISAGSYPRLAETYRIMGCGASVGRNYGPILVSKGPLAVEELGGKTIAIPGDHTTTYLLFRIYVEQPFIPVVVDFDAVGEAVSSGQVDAGLFIHEGQITWQSQGYTNILDLGKMWAEDTGLPIPLGLDVVHRRLGDEAAREITRGFEASIRYAISHEDEAVEYALPFGRGIDEETCRRFVRMYVNEDTLNLGAEGKKALETLYAKAHERGLIESVPPLDIVEP